MNFDRLRLRGITGAHDEFLLAATVQNLKKLAQQRFKPPDYRIAAPVNLNTTKTNEKSLDQNKTNEKVGI